MEKLKTAEEILKSKLDYKIAVVNNPDYTFHKVIEAMEVYANQFRGAGKNELNTSEPHLPLGDVIKSVCVSCDEETETHEVCMKCISKMIADNQQTVL